MVFVYIVVVSDYYELPLLFAHTMRAVKTRMAPMATTAIAMK
jgi:hypothetical protein